MYQFNQLDLKKLYKPDPASHKGQNGKLLIVAGSKLFHAASLWPLEIASKIVDMVYYSSVSENNEIVAKAKEHFRNGIVVRRSQVEQYAGEADCILIGPGLPRKEGQQEGEDDTKELTEKLLKQFPDKKWVIDGGSLQVMDPKFIPPTAVLTPHVGEFEKLFNLERTVLLPSKGQSLSETVSEMAGKYNCIILLKGPEDVVCSPKKCVIVSGGNAGMTKGGTGDVLAGLTASLYCKNEAFLSATCASFLNKKAAESLYEKQGYYFSSTDLINELPKVMKKYIISD